MQTTCKLDASQHLLCIVLSATVCSRRVPSRQQRCVRCLLLTLAELWDTSWGCIRLSLPEASLLEGVSHWVREGPEFRPQRAR